jgi:plastocyanin
VASVGALLVGTTYCSSDTAVAAHVDPATTYWSLTASDKAVVLAVGETLQLSATPHYYSGAAIPDLPAPTFTSQDPGKVMVDANGVLHAVDVTGGVQVVASLQAQGMTHTDTINVAVTQTATPIATFSIHPVPPDSAVVATGSYLFFNPIIRDADGNDLFGIPVSIQSTDSSRITPFFGTWSVLGLGSVSMIATTNAYGVRWKDSVEYRVTYPTFGTVTIDSAISAFKPAGVKIVAQGTVMWTNASLTPASVTFDDPTHVDGGNIVTIAPGESASRTFPTAGTFTYHGSTAALSGKVLVY